MWLRLLIACRVAGIEQIKPDLDDYKQTKEALRKNAQWMLA